jgi:hypothetical protein
MLNDWRMRAHKIGNARADQRTMLLVGAALAPWSKDIKLGEMCREFTGSSDDLVSDDEWEEIAAAAKAENQARFPDGYPGDWRKSNKSL